METYLSDNKGNRVPPHPNEVHPVAASGLTVTLATAGTDYTLTVAPGKSYRIIGTLSASVLTTDIVFAGILTVATGSEANREWAIPLGQAGIIHIPVGITTLHLTGSVSGVVVYLAKLAN